MNKLKLKAWDTERDMFVPQGEIVYTDYGDVNIEVHPNDTSYIGDSANNGEPQRGRFTIIRSSNLFDNSGDEVWEGDIREYNNIQYSLKDEGYRFVFENISDSSDDIIVLDEEVAYTSILKGNVFENTELTHKKTDMKTNGSLEIKGIISEGESKSLTCCDNVRDICIGNVSLYDKLEELFNLDEEKFWNDSSNLSQRYGIRYVILDEEPTEEKSFEQLSGEIVTQMLYADHVSGCYSEYTCGYGGFNYVVVDGGHNIFKELDSYIGKYIHFKI